jgi:hypothetical protein
MGALIPHDKNFGFHTCQEIQPWWLLDLANKFYIEYIILQNRKNIEFQGRAKNIVVEISEDGKTFEEIYCGIKSFGCDPSSDPLCLCLGGLSQVRYIRIRLRAEGILHLSRVHCLAKHALPPLDRPVFRAARSDGFGERIRALLNAVALAEHFGGSFQIHWPNPEHFKREDLPFHSISRASDTFSTQFLQKHGSPAWNTGGVRRFSEAKFDYSEINTLLSGKPKNTIVGQNLPEFLSESALRTIDPQSRLRAFEKIGFSENLRQAITAARAVELRDPTAVIHLRSGDIVFGAWRFFGNFYRKIIPFSVADALIKKLQNDGHRVIIFGQDAQLVEYLSRHNGEIDANKVRPESLKSVDQKALFDMVLMSRCDAIYSGNSGFALAASEFGGCKLHFIDRVYRDVDAYQIIHDSLSGSTLPSDIVPLQISFAHWYAYLIMNRRANRQMVHYHLSEATKIDSENALYPYIHACECYSEGADNSGDLLLMRAGAASPTDGTGLSALLGTSEHSYIARRFFPVLVSAADRGSTIAASCVAASHHAAQRPDEARSAALQATRGECLFVELVRELSAT